MMMNWLKDPVVSFVIAGILIFGLSEVFSSSEISNVIKIQDSDLQRLSGNWRMQRSREPSQEEVTDLVEQYVKDEIYFRESQRLGLHVNDSIVRRRLVQKLTFLTEDIATIQPLGEAELREYFEANIDNYRIPKRLSFSHRFFSTESRSDAEADARSALRSESKGDPFMLQSNYSGRSPTQIRGFLGDEFTDALIKLEPGITSQGPIKSAYGWHTIKLNKVEDSYIPNFEAIRKRVASDAALAVRSNANEMYYGELKERYQVIYPESLVLVE